MKIRIKQSTLESNLKKASGSLSDKDLQPMLKNFKMTAEVIGEENDPAKGPVKHTRLKIQATDLSLSTIVVLDDLLEVDEPGSITVPARKILDYAVRAAESVKADETMISISSENFRVKLSFGQNITELQGLDPDTYPAIPDWTDEGAKVLEKKSFTSALERVSPAITDDPTKSNFMMINISGGYVQASDAHRVNVVKLETGLKDFRISKGAVPELIKVLKMSGATKMRINSTDSHNLFFVGGDIFSTRRVAETLPDVIEKFVKPFSLNDQILEIDRLTFEQVINRVAITSDNEKCEVTLLLADNKCVVTSKDRDGNSAAETIPCSWTAGEDSRPKLFNYIFLSDLLKVLKGKTKKGKENLVELRFGKDSDSKRFPLYVEEGDFIAGILQRRPTP